MQIPMEIPLVIVEKQIKELFDPELIDVFHQANNLLPDDQDLLCLDFNTPVREAFKIMAEKDFSQIPIMSGNQGLGLFSYRSFALKIGDYDDEKLDLDSFRVGDFIEDIHYIDILDDWTKFLDELEERNVLIVGNQSKLMGLISSFDVVNYLNRITSPFILIGEIEKAIRIIMKMSIPKEHLPNLVKTTLKSIYGPNEMPTTLEEMTFNDYIQIIGHGNSWKYFEEVFGSERLHRNRTRTKLEEIRDIRNDVFHFKRELEAEELELLKGDRTWIKYAYIACINNRRNNNGNE